MIYSATLLPAAERQSPVPAYPWPGRSRLWLIAVLNWNWHLTNINRIGREEFSGYLRLGKISWFLWVSCNLVVYIYISISLVSNDLGLSALRDWFWPPFSWAPSRWALTWQCASIEEQQEKPTIHGNDVIKGHNKWMQVALFTSWNVTFRTVNWERPRLRTHRFRRVWDAGLVHRQPPGEPLDRSPAVGCGRLLESLRARPGARDLMDPSYPTYHSWKGIAHRLLLF